MGDLRLFSRGFITEFIELYKSFPCLWDAKAKDYVDRTKRNRAYDALVAKYREVDTSATKEKVKKKLYALRSCYFRELGKLMKSVRTSTTVEEVYKPTLWYFYLFDFLTDLEMMKEPTSTTDGEGLDGECIREEEVEYEEEVIHEEYQELEEEPTDDDDTVTIKEDDFEHKDPFENDPHTSATPRTHSNAEAPSTSQAKKRKPHPDQAEPVVDTRVEDQFDVYGKLIAHKLRSFDKLQATFSQRLINEILYEAEMGFLTRNSRLVDMGESP